MLDDAAALDSQSQFSPEEKALAQQLFRMGSGGKGFLTGAETAPLLKRSKLGDAILAQIWELADKENKGRLSIIDFTRALRMVALAQQNKPFDLVDAKIAISPPKFEGLSLPAPTVATTADVFFISPDEKARFADMFEKSGSRNGLLDGGSARDIFLKSNLSKDILGQIWNLVDTTKSGSLNLQQFSLGMSLLQKKLLNPLLILPNALPPHVATSLSSTVNPSYDSFALRPSAAVSRDPSSNSLMPPLLSSGLSQAPSGASIASTSAWVISPEDRQKYDGYFLGLDTTKKGFLIGNEAVSFFLKSGLPESVLAEIWNLIDFDKSGRLDKEKFAAGMYLVQKKIAGASLPGILPPSLIQNAAGSNLASTPIMPQTASSTLSRQNFGSSHNLAAPIDVNKEKSLLQDKMSESTLRQEEILAHQSKLSSAQAELEEIQTKRAALEESIAKLDKESAELAGSIKSTVSKKDEELIRFASLQVGYIESQKTLQDLYAKYEAEKADMDKLVARVNTGTQYLEQQKQALAEARELYERAIAEKKALESRLEVERTEFSNVMQEIQDVQSQTLALNGEISKLRLEVDKQKSITTAKDVELKAAHHAKLDAQKQIDLLQKQENTVAEQPSKHAPTVVLKTPSGRENGLFDTNWDTASITSAKSDSHAQPNFGLVRTESTSSAKASKPTKVPAKEVVKFTDADPFAEFEPSLKQDVAVNAGGVPTKNEDFHTINDVFGGSVSAPAAVPASQHAQSSIFNDDFFTNGVSAPTTAFPTQKTEHDPFGMDPFGEPVAAPDNSVKEQKSGALLESFKPASNANSVTSTTTVSPVKGFDVKKAEKEFDTKFPSVDEFEQSFTPGPKPIDDFDAEFSELSKDPNAAVIVSSNTEEFEKPFETVLPILTKSSPTYNQSTKTEKNDGLNVASQQNPFKSNPASNTSFNSNFDDPFDFNSAFSATPASPAPSKMAAAATTDVNAIFAPSNVQPSATSNGSKLTASTVFDDAFANSDPFGSKPFTSDANTVSVSINQSAFDQSFFDAVQPSASSGFTKPEKSPPPNADTSFFGKPDINGSNNPGNISNSFFDQLSATNSKISLPGPPNMSPPTGNDAKVAEIVAMGFSEEQAKEALARYDNNLQKATNFLLDGGEKDDAESLEVPKVEDGGSSKSPATKQKSGKWWKRKKKEGESNKEEKP